MSQDTKQAAMSAVERNLENIGERRQRLRGADRGPGTDPSSVPGNGGTVPEVTEADSGMDLATVSARATLSMAGVLNDFSTAVVNDITRAGQQVARLHEQATRAFTPAAPAASSRIRPEAVDVEVVDVDPSPIA